LTDAWSEYHTSYQMIKVGGWSLCHNHWEVHDRRSSSVLLTGANFFCRFLSFLYLHEESDKSSAS